MRNYLLKYNLLEACFILFGYSFPWKIRDVTVDDIKKAYRKKAKIYHPDRATQNGTDDEKKLSEIFNKLTNAYNLLLDFKKETPKLPKKESAEHENKKHSGISDFYYTGRLPERELRFGEFLFYSKVISWKTLIKAIIYQNRNRPRFGEICLAKNILSQEELNFIIKSVLPGEKFAEAAFRMKLLSEREIFLILNHQRKLNMPFGKYFTDKEILSEEKLLEYLLLYKNHNLKMRKKNF